MSTILAYVDLTILGYVAVFVATLVFSQKIKDFFSGVPTELRTGLKSVETSLLADVKGYQSSLVAKLIPGHAPVAPAAPVVVAAPVAPVAPVAPAA